MTATRRDKDLGHPYTAITEHDHCRQLGTLALECRAATVHGHRTQSVPVLATISLQTQLDYLMSCLDMLDMMASENTSYTLYVVSVPGYSMLTATGCSWNPCSTNCTPFPSCSRPQYGSTSRVSPPSFSSQDPAPSTKTARYVSGSHSSCSSKLALSGPTRKKERRRAGPSYSISLEWVRSLRAPL